MKLRPLLPSSVYVAFIQRHIPTGHEHLLKELDNELRDVRYAGRKHGTRTTRNAGCTGPMCRKAQRDYRRNHHRDTRADKIGTLRVSPYAQQDPIIQMFIDKHVGNQLDLQAV